MVSARSATSAFTAATCALLLAGCSAQPSGSGSKLDLAVQGAGGAVSLGVSAGSEPGDIGVALQVLAVLTILSIAPALLVMVTSFTRIVVVLAFIRTAVGIPQMPPNQVLLGLALFLTYFVMAPTLDTVNSEALQPYMRGELSQEVALDRAAQPLREFMLRQTREKDLALFIQLSRQPRPAVPEDVPTHALIPAFVISELKTAFQMGFVIFIPFLIIDMVISSALMSMGMMMLPPAMISLPFKVLLFVMVDGWYLVVGSLVRSFA